ncbi:MAG TPA: hypothetical protein VF516_24775 [Kofleriaceae bacterium]
MAIAGAVLLCMLVATLVGCVIPPSLRVDEENNSPPVITSVSGDSSMLADPGPVVVEAGTTSSNLVLTLLDTDDRDDLHVRLFVDYNAPDRLPARVACDVPHNDSNPQAKRTATCNLSGLCLTSDIGMQRGLMLVVFDRPPPDFGADPQAIAAPGLSSYRFFFLRCQPPQTP